MGRGYQHLELHRLSARRLNVRYKKKGEKGTHFVHTLNGTAIALSRGLIAVMETTSKRMVRF